jgi:hypothetical protein
MAETGATRGASQSRSSHVTFTLPNGHPLLVRLFPANERLAVDVERVGAKLLPRSRTEPEFRAALQNTLRHWYPQLEIHEQQPLAAIWDGDLTWYLLRDGRVHRENPRVERLHTALGSARDLTEDAQAAIRRSRSIRVGARTAADGAEPARGGDDSMGDDAYLGDPYLGDDDRAD